jgi:hypothetical protein
MNPTRDFKPLLAAVCLFVSAGLLLAQSPPNKLFRQHFAQRGRELLGEIGIWTWIQAV